MIEEMLKNAIKPYIKPGVKNFNDFIVKMLTKTHEELNLSENDEVVIIITKRDDKAIITPAVVSADDKVYFPENLNNLTFDAQPLSTFILRNLKI